MNNRPQRRGLPDRLLDVDASEAEVTCDVAIAPFDRAMREAEHRWGYDRLPELVSTETATKWGRTMGRLNTALAQSNADEVARIAASAIRGLAVMEREAEAAGETPTNFWEYELDGFRFAIIDDERRREQAAQSRPDLEIYSMREVGTALREISKAGVGEAKKAFPKARVIKLTPSEKLPPSFWEHGGDEIPF